MKSLNIALLFALIATLSGTSITAKNPTASTPPARSPEIVIKEFYKWYIYSINHYKKATNPYEGGKVILKKYVTVGFIRAIDRNEKLLEAMATLNELAWLRPDLQWPRERLSSLKHADEIHEENKR